MGNTNLWREVVVLGVACILLRTGAKANQPPIITAGMENHQIPEDTLVGTTVYTLDATDADGDTLTYGVGQAYGVSGQVTNLFMVDPSTGVVTLRTQLDREVSWYSSIFITDANDNSPVFQGIPYEVNVNENDIQQTSIFRVTATDADQGIRGTVSYYLEDGDETKFEVDRPTGVVNLREALDYEESPIHLVWIRAQDGGGSYRGNQVVQNSTTVLIVHVVDEDDEFPLFLGLPCSTHVNEDTPLGTSIITITAEDEDCGICNNTIIYCTDERDRIAISTVVGVAVGTTMLGILVGILATILAQRYCANLYKCPEAAADVDDERYDDVLAVRTDSRRSMGGNKVPMETQAAAHTPTDPDDNYQDLMPTTSNTYETGL
ncbi:PREDICTED: cadherin-related family member 1-like isoform X2 [Branchiostoma belcheri]|uniref:Cadherin-related family member 1-like isoform X2 n=1 Tax=Branchiostoma belcheri TaxID=7741 RepID=A0A6P5A6I6_BRABE|nr:PREDICTED: cadherin-related family member 1-like isoform X2 [Branchiostoma belcheri]